MLKAPFYASITLIILLPIVIFFFNIILVLYLGTRMVDEYRFDQVLQLVMLGTKIMNGYRIDKIIHVIGGVGISFSAAGIVWHLVHRNLIKLVDQNVHRAVIFGFVCFAAIGWEVLEYLFVYPIFPKDITYTDTITDMISGLVGGFFAILLLRRPVG